MSFFVVERGRGGVSLRIPLPQDFESREAALEAMSAALTAGEVAIEGEIFVVDLAAAVPVLLMPGTGVAPAAHEPDAAASVSPSAPVEVPEVAVETVYDAWAEAVTEAQPADGLADALKRAATSLESEGIVAPASIESDAASEADAWAKDASAVVVEPISAIGFVGETPEVPAETPEVPAEPLEGGSWPWTNVAPVEAEQAGAEERDLVAETVAAFEQEGSEDVAMLAPVPDGTDAYLPRPVILGDYDETPGAPSDPDDVLAALVNADDAALEYVTLPEPEADADDAVTAALTGTDPLEHSPVAAAVDATAVGQADETTAAGYEAGTELDLGAYTCDDCVYSNTCPKVGQSAPAECGSFQWRSE